MIKTVVHIWRWVCVLFGAVLASLSTFLQLAKYIQIDIAGQFNQLTAVSPVPIALFYTAYLSIGFLYLSLFFLMDSDDLEFESFWERIAAYSLIIFWPLGLFGEIIGERMIVTNAGIVRRVANFLALSIFVRLVLILGFGIGALYLINSAMLS